MRLTRFPALAALLLPAFLAQPAAAGVDAWTSLGPPGGWIDELAADPESPGTVYAGTVTGSIWKTVDGGHRWTLTPDLGAGFIGGLAVSRGRVFAATENGVAVLTEGADAWRPGGPGSPQEALCLTVDPTSPDRLWAGLSGGQVFLSEDGGGHWSQKIVLASSITSVAVAPTAPPTVYVAGDFTGAFKSTTAGSAWSQIVPGDFPGPGPSGPIALSLDPGKPGTLYAGASNRVWKSTDAGRTWAALSPVFSYPSPLLALPDSLLVGTDAGLMHSEDGGATWRLQSGLFRVLSLAADPFAPGGAWIGSGQQGVYHTADGGRTWQPSRGGLTASFVSGLTFEPSRPRSLYLKANGARLYRSDDAGGSWQLLPLASALSVAADPWHPGTLYAAAGGGLPGTGVWISRNRGTSWHSILKPPDKRGIGFVAVDPAHPGTVFAGGLDLRRSNNGGHTWKVLPRLQGNLGTQKLLFSPWHPGTLYRFEGVYLERSTDGGDSWEEILPERQGVAAIAFDPETPDLLYAADSNFAGIWKSPDGGTTWENVVPFVSDSAVVTAAALLVDPLDSAVLYLGSRGAGLWRSRDHGATWEPVPFGFRAPSISCFEADPRDPRRLFACTQGAGLLEIERTE